MVRALKIIHTLGSIGLVGGVLAVMVSLGRARVDQPGYGELRATVDALFTTVLVPSLVACILSGLASMFAHAPYWNALWAWAKCASGMGVLAVTFRARGLALDVSSPEVWGDAVAMRETLRTETSLWWLLLGLGVFNVVVGVWRPRLAMEQRRADA